uniref:Inactive serine protease 54 isoform X3 n=1 Tax=Geotrypetes seraphini TaxID=260995 RepID=A0A6P8QP14_GEOSA|nr:inactive serine protease 54 isoform X3 [Geotrypetes seraphini]
MHLGIICILAMKWWLLLCFCIPQTTSGCGIINDSIPNNANMKLTLLNGFPWLVSLQDVNGTHLVTGSIISKYWIVSVASSFQDRKKTMAVVGLTELKKESEVEKRYQQYMIDTVIIHEDFNEITMDHNIAILKTITAISFSDYVQPICFSGRSVTSEALVNCQVSGRRQLYAEGSPAKSQWQTLSVVDISPCPLRRTMAMECCSHRDSDDTEGSVGNPGNPISCQYKKNGLWVLKGILNHGGMKNFGPFLYNRISYYRNWILAETAAADIPFYPTLNSTEHITFLDHVNITIKSRNPIDDQDEEQGARSMNSKLLDDIYYDYYNDQTVPDCGLRLDHFQLLKVLLLLLLSLLFTDEENEQMLVENTWD